MTPLGRIRALLLLLPVALLAGCGGADENSGDTSQTIAGTWAGAINHTYYCEATPEDIQLDIADATVTVTGGNGPFPVGTTGTITPQQGHAYTVTLDDGGAVEGQLLVHPSGSYALLAIYAGPNASSGYVSVLQKRALAAVTYSEGDLVGDWAGTAARVDADFAVTSTAQSTATITNPDGLQLTGSDGDGAFGGSIPSIILEFPADGVYVSGWGAASQIDWPNASYDAIYALSYDKTVLAAAFLTSVCSTTVFDDLPAQKFALWRRQP